MNEPTPETGEQIVLRAQRALIAALQAADADAPPGDVADVTSGASFYIPVLIPEGVESGDGRTFASGSLSTRDFPLPLLWQVQTDDGHDGSYLVGRIDSADQGDGGITNARGVFDSGPYGREAERLVRAQMLRGVSADLDQFEASVNGTEISETSDGSEPVKIERDSIKNDEITVTKGRVMAATLVPKPAFQECSISLDDAGYNEPVSDGEYVEEAPASDALTASLAAVAASAAPTHPPREWLDNPRLSRPTPLTVTDDGRVFGHIAAWNVSHIGLPGNTRPPRSASDYAYFKTGLLRTAEGDDVAVGQLTLAGGHAPLHADAASAVRHYDDTASAVADVVAGEDDHGIWVSGALRPGVTPDQVRTLRASAPSGDWRPIRNRLELVAVCQVNVPGFPVARAVVAGGQVTALVAAGAQLLASLRDQPMNELEDRVHELEQLELRRLRAPAVARLQQLSAAREEALTASVRSAAERMEWIREVQQRNADALTAAAAAARARIAALGDPEFKEELHPRSTNGKFRDVLLRLSDALKSVPGADSATKTLESAASKANSGDDAEAHDAAQQAKAQLDDATKNATDDASRATLGHLRDQLSDALSGAPSEDPRHDAPAPPAAKDSGVTIEFGKLPPEVQQLLRTIVQRLTPGTGATGLRDFISGGSKLTQAEVGALLAKALTPGA